MKISRNLIVGVTAALTIAASVIPASMVAASGQSEIAQVRRATAAFHDVRKADDAGYAPFLGCFDAPGVGGMGQHYVNGDLVDGTVDALRPEALVYEVHGDGLRLVGVEYIVPRSAWTGADPPELFGQPFHALTVAGDEIWALHAYIWRPNPDGMFANFNPAVALCP